VKTILHAFNIDADAEKVTAALTTVDGLAAWWSTRVAGAATAGEVINFTFGDDFNPDMRVADTRDGVVVWECVGGHQPWADNVFRFEFSDTAPVAMVFHQEYARELDDIAYGTYNFNWGYYLDSLRLYCETGTGKPYAATTSY
jgi:hypothetical protein